MTNKATFYTSGCSNNEDAGVGLYSTKDQYLDLSQPIGREPSNRTQIRAAIEAVKTAKDSNYDSVVVRSNSDHVVRGYNEWMPSWTPQKFDKVQNGDLYKELNSVCQTMDVKFEKNKGHNPARSLARQGMSQNSKPSRY